MLNKIIAFQVLLFLTVSILSQENPIYAPGNPDSYVQQYPMPSYLDTNLIVQGVWSRLNNLPKALIGVNAYYYQATNKIFICGGSDQNSVPNDTCWWYDVTAGTYQQAAFLPQGRWSGKLVRVKENLYLVGSIGSTFSSADGLIFKYALQQNTWAVADTMPAPFVHESAVCVIRDSLIVMIGGSSSGYSGARNFVRIYDPELNHWQNSTSFPLNITTAHCEYNTASEDSAIFVFGGYNAGNLNTVYKGIIDFNIPDSSTIVWSLYTNTPFNSGVYRVAGAKWNDYMLIGPAMSGSLSLNNIWGLSISDSLGYWTKFSPVSADTAGNISSFAVMSGNDSNYFYLFGGYKNPNILNIAQKFSFITPPPIGIISSNGIPKKFKLYQNYPNPFNPVTKIRFDIAAGNISLTSNIVKLSIYDILGKLIVQYEYSNLKMGSYEIEFDGRDLSSGLYCYTVTSGNISETKKMILIK